MASAALISRGPRRWWVGAFCEQRRQPFDGDIAAWVIAASDGCAAARLNYHSLTQMNQFGVAAEYRE
jgi:hypothetical protein